MPTPIDQVGEVLADLFSTPERLVIYEQAQEYTKKDADSDQPKKNDET